MLKKYKIDRIISILTLVTSVIAVYLVIKRPQPVAQPQSPAMVAQNAKSFEEKIEQLEKPKEPDAQPAEVHINSNEASAFVQSANAIPAAAAQLTPNTDIGAMPVILDQQVSFD